MKNDAEKEKTLSRCSDAARLAALWATLKAIKYRVGIAFMAVNDSVFTHNKKELPSRTPPGAPSP